MSQVIERTPEPIRSLRRKYSDLQIASALVALDANLGNVFKTSAELGIPHKTLDEWAKGRRNVPEIVNLRSKNARDVADIFEETARNYLSQAADPYVIGATSGRDAVFAAAIAVDKMQLLRGQPTEIVENVESHKVLVLMAGALGVEDEAIDVTPTASFAGENAERSPAGDSP